MYILKLSKSEDYYDANNQIFVPSEEKIIKLEHSLAAISKWEAIWEIPFLSQAEKTTEQILSYIECMNVSLYYEKFAHRLSDSEKNSIAEYINAKMTATTIYEAKPQISREIITAEIIYFWMITFGIPQEYQHWHLNKLLALIDVCRIKNSPQKKLSRAEQFAQQRAINEARRAKMGTSG